MKYRVVKRNNYVEEWESEPMEEQEARNLCYDKNAIYLYTTTYFMVKPEDHTLLTSQA